MSKRKKRLRRQVIEQMLAKKISVPEARARMDWVKKGRYQPPRAGKPGAMAVKSAGPVTGYERYDTHPDPQVREWARAAHRDLVTKGLVPWETPARQQPGNVKAMVRAPGPDGTAGWRVLRTAPPSGPPVVPPGTAGR